MRRSSSVCCRSACLVLLLSVISRTTLEMPMVTPEGALIGEMLSETSIGLPSLRKRTVSLCSMLSPQPIRRRMSCTSGSRSLGDEQRDALAGGFRRGVSEQAFGGRIPSRDGAVERQGDDGVVGRFDRGAEQPFALRMVIARRDRATMFPDLAFECRGLGVRFLDHARERAREHAGLAAARRPESRPYRCGRPPRRLPSIGRSAGSTIARSVGPAPPRIIRRSVRL